MKNVYTFNEHCNCRGILTPGRQISFGKINGYIDRIEGSNIWIEVLGEGANETRLEKFNIIDVVKKLKV